MLYHCYVELVLILLINCAQEIQAQEQNQMADPFSQVCLLYHYCV